MIELSVIIPCLNEAAVLEGQLRALGEEQAPFDWEVVIVDNGSTDATAEVAESCAAPLPSLRVVQEPARGRHFACNAGAEVARAEKLAFVDADDIIAPGYVVAMAQALDESEVVAGRLVHVAASGSPVEGFGQVQVDGLMPTLGFLPFASGANLGVRREVFLAVGGFDGDIPFAEDTDLSWRLQLSGHPIEFRSDVAVRYHQRSSLRAMFRQHRRFGAAQPRLYDKYRAHGMPRRSASAVAGDWWRSVTALPFLRDRQVRARFVRRLARNLGRIEGSVRVRRLYL